MPPSARAVASGQALLFQRRFAAETRLEEGGKIEAGTKRNRMPRERQRVRGVYAPVVLPIVQSHMVATPIRQRRIGEVRCYDIAEMRLRCRAFNSQPRPAGERRGR